MPPWPNTFFHMFFEFAKNVRMNDIMCVVTRVCYKITCSKIFYYLHKQRSPPLSVLANAPSECSFLCGSEFLLSILGLKLNLKNDWFSISALEADNHHYFQRPTRRCCFRE